MVKKPFINSPPIHFLFLIGVIITAAVVVFTAQINYLSQERNITQLSAFAETEVKLTKTINQLRGELKSVTTEDQFVKNKNLEKEISEIKTNYQKTVTVYESLLDLKPDLKTSSELDKLFTRALTQLAVRNYASASATLSELSQKIATEKAKVTAQFSIPKNVPASNAPPSSGFAQQRVTSDVGEFLVSLVSASLDSTRIIVDTASDGTCKDNCPVSSLADYVSRNGAFAGINGAYFCPASYPSCAGKTNSFDTLLMNKNKVYFNSENNVYSTVPAVIFGGGWIRFVSRSLDWGRDTGIDSMIANQPLLLLGGNIQFGGDGDPKKGSKGSRSFIGAKDKTVYIGVVHNATVAEAAHVLKTLGLSEALNLDSGGSTALWSGGYKAGPGRNIPNAILFVKK